MSKNVSMITFGCKLNQAETQAMADKLNCIGYNITFDEKNGKNDIYVINTCTVTSEAERKIRQLIRRIKRKNNDVKVIAVGCYVHTDAEKLKDIGADLVLGNLEKKFIDKYINDSGVILNKSYWLKNQDKIITPEKSFDDRTRIFIPIEEGCLNACSYCRIIFSRGTSIRSLPINKVLKAISNYIDLGYKELVLTGINLNQFGFDNAETLTELLEKIEENFGEDDIRIRLTSMYPEYVDKKMVEIIFNSKIFEKHVHLSIQHFSNKILNLMGRKYDKNKIIEAIELFRERDKFFSITSDIIVGFPYEEDEDFQELLNSIKDMKILKVHGFRFSARPGTKASKMKNQVLGNIKKDRIETLNLNSKNISEDYRKELIGKEVTILSEKIDDNYIYGYDEYYIHHKCDFKNINPVKNKFYRVKIQDISDEGVSSYVL